MNALLVVLVFIICISVIAWCLYIYKENRKLKAEESKMLDDDGELPFTS